MGTDIRPELSERNKYWLTKHRYYELKHFCLQYPVWKQAYSSLDGLSKRPLDLEIFAKTGQTSDPTAKCAEAKEAFSRKIEMVEIAAIQSDRGLGEYIIRGVTEGLSYEVLKARYNIPCSKDVYYDRYRCFFWILNKLRD